jgi:hypothetical protein
MPIGDDVENTFQTLVCSTEYTFPILLFISDHPILQTLETRAGDKLAQDFVKKQKLRISNS